MSTFIDECGGDELWTDRAVGIAEVSSKLRSRERAVKGLFFEGKPRSNHRIVPRPLNGWIDLIEALIIKRDRKRELEGVVGSVQCKASKLWRGGNIGGAVDVFVNPVIAVVINAVPAFCCAR